MSRTLLHTRNELSNLTANNAHRFATQHAMQIYPDFIYSFIPKNACSTMRLSIAIHNGAIRSENEVNWIHKNNNTWVPSLKDVLTAKYTFVILRCPIKRIYSVFFDKFVSKEQNAWNLFERLDRIEPLDEWTFNSFLERISIAGNLRSDIHWRPQRDFLIYDSYDDYFDLGDFVMASSVISSKTGMNIKDSRNLLRHDTSRYNKTKNGYYGNTPIRDLVEMKKSGFMPSIENCFDDQSLSTVRKLYKRDFQLLENVGLRSAITELN